MKIKFELWGQLKQSAGKQDFEVEVEDGSTVQAAVQKLADTGGDALKAILLSDDGGCRESNLVFVDGNQMNAADALKEGSTVTLMSPIAGG